VWRKHNRKVFTIHILVMVKLKYNLICLHCYYLEQKLPSRKRTTDIIHEFLLSESTRVRLPLSYGMRKYVDKIFKHCIIC